ncbi:MAG: phospho-N-acetylmuramoyl-pentapeptide-transferase [Kiritimatiellia bacterium]
MLYYLSLLEAWFSPLRIFQYITVRTVAAAGTSLLVCLFAGPWMIASLRALKIGQQVRTGNAPDHQHKQNTPTMGGVLIVAGITIACLLWARPSNRLVQVAVGTLLVMGGIGFGDDFLKIRKRHSGGLSARSKMVLQCLWTCVVVAILWSTPETSVRLRQLMIPFHKEPLIGDIGLIAAFFVVFAVLVGSANAVNLTDGLDGLAVGCASSVSLSYLAMAYLSGHALFAQYLYIPYIPGAGELSVFCGAIAGASLGFLWYNCHPAHVFMGDTGSLALGGAIGIVAILIKQEVVLLLVGGVFVMEALSVILQVASFRLTGKRIFRMAPIHHHFEKAGWSETQVTIRFWILSIIFALLGLLTLKLR